METKRDGNIIQIGERFRVETGPRLMRAVATERLLDNTVTAPHYALEVDDTPDGEPPRPGRDATGELIELGKEMAYLDWTGVDKGHEGALVYYVYRLDDMTDDEIDVRSSPEGEPPEDTTIWREIAVCETEEAALTEVFSQAGV